ncbi:hypothetical protein MJO29_009143 [Puccinia striiformis f. sp. tritici]|nr:hypothetical protein MJO29_009143 [Puccinia striiformis f. sp. tritici]
MNADSSLSYNSTMMRMCIKLPLVRSARGLGASTAAPHANPHTYLQKVDNIKASDSSLNRHVSLSRLRMMDEEELVLDIGRILNNFWTRLATRFKRKVVTAIPWKSLVHVPSLFCTSSVALFSSLSKSLKAHGKTDTENGNDQSCEKYIIQELQEIK